MPAAPGKPEAEAHELEIIFSHGLNADETRNSINQNQPCCAANLM